MSGIKFGEYHTVDDWGLFCSGIEIEAPELQRYQVEIPGRNGKLELTDILFDGETKYYNRAGTFTFDSRVWIPQAWHDLTSEIRGAVHGKELNIILDEDPDWYYTGICEVSADEDEGTIEITSDMQPYKLAVSETVVSVTGSGTVILQNDVMPVIPEITVTDEATIVYGSSSYALSAGTYTMTGIVLYEGQTELEITTDGTVTITYRQGRL